jgi:hypothetical protein
MVQQRCRIKNVESGLQDFEMAIRTWKIWKMNPEAVGQAI